MAYKQKCFAFSCQYAGSAYVIFIGNLTLTSCVVTNFQSSVVGSVMLIGK